MDKPLSETLDLCRALIRTPSYGSRGGEGEIVNFIKQVLVDAGANDLRVLAGQERRPNLVCTLDSGEPGPSLVIACHTDVYESDTESWTADPLQPEIRNGELWGAGASDAKGGLAAMMAAARRLIAKGGPRAGRLILAFTADEDCTGQWGLPWLVDSGYIEGDAAIALTPAGFEQDYDGVPIASRGFINVNVTVRSPDGGYTWCYDPGTPHAVAVAAKLLTAIEQDFRPDPAAHPLFPGGPTVVAGSTFSGGDFAGALPQVARFSLEARLLPGTRADSFVNQLKEFISNIAGAADVQVEPADVWLGGYADGCDLAPTHPLAAAALEAVHSHGYREARFSGNPLFCEGALIAAAGIPTLPALGPGRVNMAHKSDERASIHAIENCAGILSTLIDRILCSDSILN